MARSKRAHDAGVVFLVALMVASGAGLARAVTVRAQGATEPSAPFGPVSPNGPDGSLCGADVIALVDGEALAPGAEAGTEADATGAAAHATQLRDAVAALAAGLAGSDGRLAVVSTGAGPVLLTAPEATDTDPTATTTTVAAGESSNSNTNPSPFVTPSASELAPEGRLGQALATLASRPAGDGAIDWDAGYRAAADLGAQARPDAPLVVVHVAAAPPTQHRAPAPSQDVVTDGGSDAHVRAAVLSANALKTRPHTHVVATGVGPASQLTAELSALSGPTVAPFTNGALGAGPGAGVDVVTVGQWDQLPDALGAIGAALCSSTVTVNVLAGPDGAVSPKAGADVAATIVKGSDRARFLASTVGSSSDPAAVGNATSDAAGRVVFTLAMTPGHTVDLTLSETAASAPSTAAHTLVCGAHAPGSTAEGTTLVTDTTAAVPLVTGITAGSDVRCDLRALEVAPGASLEPASTGSAGASGDPGASGSSGSSEASPVTPGLSVRRGLAAGVANPEAACDPATSTQAIAPGSSVAYCYVVTNTGTTHLDGIEITDGAVGISGLALGARLAPGTSGQVSGWATLVTLAGGDSIAASGAGPVSVTGHAVDASGNPLPGVGPVATTSQGLVVTQVLSSPDVNGVVSVAITVTNPTPTPVTGVTVTAPNCAALPSGPQRQADNGDNALDQGESWVYHCEITSQAATFSTAFVSAAQTDTTETTVPLPTRDSVDLRVQKKQQGDLRLTGTTTYQIRVTNNGDVDAVSTVMTDALPPEVQFVSVTTDRGSCSGGQTVVCNLGNLPPAEVQVIHATILVTVQALPGNGGKVVANQATVSSSTREFDPQDNVSTAYGTVQGENPTACERDCVPTTAEPDLPTATVPDSPSADTLRLATTGGDTDQIVAMALVLVASGLALMTLAKRRNELFLSLRYA